MDNKLSCRTCEQYMNSFIDNTLIGDDLWDFLNHVMNCPTCYEELETRYLISEALIRLENGETIDLQKELADKINTSRHTLRAHRHFEAFFRSLEVLASVIVTFELVELLFRYI